MPDKYSVDHYYILLSQMCRSPAIADLALSQLQGSYFTRKEIGGNIAQAIIFNSIKEHVTTYGLAPDDGTLHTYVITFIDARLKENRTLYKEIQKCVAHFIGFKGHVDERSEKLSRDIIEYIANICVFKPAAAKLLSDATQTGDMKDTADKLYELEAQKSILKGGLSVNAISGLKLADVGDRVSTNIAWLDSYFGSGVGPVRGCVVGIIAPQGGGKTTLGIQLGVRQALAHRHSLLVLAEEGLTLPMRCKIFASALGIPYPSIQEAPAASFDDKLRIAVESSKITPTVAAKKIAAVDQFLHVLDLVETNGDISSVQGELQTLKQQGKPPIYTYVDWAGIMADRMMQKTGRTKEQELKAISYALSKYAQQSNSIIAVSQQMAPLMVQKGPFYMNDFTCAADCKGFSEPMKYVLVINKQDPKTKYSIMSIVKSRDDNALGIRAVVKLRGDIAAFEDLSDQYEIAGKRFVRVGHADSPTRIPSEEKIVVGEVIESAK